jgi:4-amino-4-deoxy-L-arabinose transferase-like glycosyltransferase
LPWLVFFIVGFVAACMRRGPSDRIALLLLLVPLFIMCFFKDKAERYLLPMFPAIAFMTAVAVVEHIRAAKWKALDRWINAGHWAILIAIGVGVPLAGSGWLRQMQRIDGQPWFSSSLGLEAAAASAVIIAVSLVLQKRRPPMLVAATLVIMLGIQVLFMAGYAETAQGRAEFRPLCELILNRSSDAEVFNAHPKGKRPPPEMAVYLNRVLRWTPDASKLEPGPHPKVLLVPQNKGEPRPALLPGWSVLGSHNADGDVWWAYLLPARS